METNSKYAVLTSCSGNYKQYMNVFLNSLDFCGHTHDVHVITVDMDEEYLKKALDTKWTFKLFTHKRERKDFEQFESYNSLMLTSKRCRYPALEEYSEPYDVMCLIDIDMMIVNNFMKFFELVDGTDMIIGCNERFKWPLDRYVLKGYDFPKIYMDWMICNAPTLFSPVHSKELLKAMIKCSRELTNRDGEYPSDLFTMNVALWVAGATDRVVMLPAYAWTGVHLTYTDITTRIMKKGGQKWVSWCGEPVYIIHGKWDRNSTAEQAFKNQQKRYNELNLSEDVRKKLNGTVNSTIKQIQNEFKFFNTECKLKLEQKDG